MSAHSKSGKITIKKYANRRLYDTSASRYVTLDHLRDLVKENAEFEVVDAKTGEDLTRGVLAQIIFEEEAKGANLLPVEFLRQLIGFYGDSMQAFVPGYLKMSMEGLMRQQDELREKMTGAMSSPASSMALLEEQTRRNMAMFEQAMKVFSPFNAAGQQDSGTPAPAARDKSDDVKALRDELEAMRAKLDKLAGG
ncbi:polyhydroxyalkonate synthesis repressor, PhaR [Glycocaulis alkaliphilus]|uniref:Polyhydroxyalkonate synthesis repressor, PhaR n=1 Tax=Glycocaulis alkaliphilus TaxID=1434191 RepID=A0A3T0E6J7_9PROT|nr:polyhydroxyalkanoate synthesis repressor PhaR [Glycocaulis alkaliphilus]AZU02919.1 polyhydroxyalkonate synthesis repressor, PhaR [Glycocaulis alkaliphilus]GGB84289.1 methyl-accepting chemotaxis protein [Glycocaulis alkaliphilus]